MMLLKANSLAAGCSGVRLIVVELLLDLLNAGVLPVIPEQDRSGHRAIWHRRRT
jgi:histidine ammonia-lyase